MPEKKLSSHARAETSAEIRTSAERAASLRIAFDLLRQFWPMCHITVSAESDNGCHHAISLASRSGEEIGAFCFDSISYMLAVLYHFTEESELHRVEECMQKVADNFSTNPDATMRAFFQIVRDLKPESLQ